MSARIIKGTIEFVWDTDGHMLVNMEPDDPGDPHTFELTGELRERLAGKVAEGSRVEVEFEPVPYEVIDPDSGPSESLRAEVRDLRVVSQVLALREFQEETEEFEIWRRSADSGG